MGGKASISQIIRIIDASYKRWGYLVLFVLKLLSKLEMKNQVPFFCLLEMGKFSVVCH